MNPSRSSTFAPAVPPPPRVCHRSSASSASPVSAGTAAFYPSGFACRGRRALTNVRRARRAPGGWIPHLQRHKHLRRDVSVGASREVLQRRRDLGHAHVRVASRAPEVDGAVTRPRRLGRGGEESGDARTSQLADVPAGVILRAREWRWRIRPPPRRPRRRWSWTSGRCSGPRRAGAEAAPTARELEDLEPHERAERKEPGTAVQDVFVCFSPSARRSDGGIGGRRRVASARRGRVLVGRVSEPEKPREGDEGAAATAGAGATAVWRRRIGARCGKRETSTFVPTSRAEDGAAIATRDARHAARARTPTVGIRADIAAMASPADLRVTPRGAFESDPARWSDESDEDFRARRRKSSSRRTARSVREARR